MVHGIKNTHTQGSVVLWVDMMWCLAQKWYCRPNSVEILCDACFQLTQVLLGEGKRELLSSPGDHISSEAPTRCSPHLSKWIPKNKMEHFTAVVFVTFWGYGICEALLGWKFSEEILFIPIQNCLIGRNKILPFLFLGSFSSCKFSGLAFCFPCYKNSVWLSPALQEGWSIHSVWCSLRALPFFTIYVPSHFLLRKVKVILTTPR